MIFAISDVRMQSRMRELMGVCFATPGSGGLAVRLLWARAKAGLSLRKAMELSRVPYATIWRGETGVSAPSVEQIEALAKTYGVRAAWLAFGDGEHELQTIEPGGRNA